MPRCRSCGGGRSITRPQGIQGGYQTNMSRLRGRTMPSSNVTTSEGADPSGPEPTVEIEYVGGGNPSVRGRGTGQLYYFNKASGHNTQNVYASDIAGVLSMEGYQIFHPPILSAEESVQMAEEFDKGQVTEELVKTIQARRQQLEAE